jgi:activating signal cointegrator complex subunit 3
MLRNPMVYGIPYDERAIDHLLLGRRKALIEFCAQQLHKCRMIRFDAPSGNFFATDLGRVASHYYIDFRSIETFNEKMKQFMTDEQILDCISSSREFEQVKVREEEMDELEGMMADENICWFDIVGGSATSPCAKTNILLQAYISQARIDAFTLVSDQVCVSFVFYENV